MKKLLALALIVSAVSFGCSKKEEATTEAAPAAPAATTEAAPAAPAAEGQPAATTEAAPAAPAAEAAPAAAPAAH